MISKYFEFANLTKIRSRPADEIPESLKIAFAVGIGLFLTFIGLNDTGLVKLGIPGAPVQVGNLGDSESLLALLGFMITGVLMIRKVNAALIVGTLITTILGFLFGVTSLPDKFIDFPPSISSVVLKLDIAGAVTWGFAAIILLN